MTIISNELGSPIALTTIKASAGLNSFKINAKNLIGSKNIKIEAYYSGVVSATDNTTIDVYKSLTSSGLDVTTPTDLVSTNLDLDYGVSTDAIQSKSVDLTDDAGFAWLEVNINIAGVPDAGAMMSLNILRD